MERKNWGYEDRYLVQYRFRDTITQHYMGWMPRIEKVTDNPDTQVKIQDSNRVAF
jgi:hypothetical protein